MNRPEYVRRLDFDELQYDQIVSVGIAAAKSGEREQARTLLFKATEMKPDDTRPWLWLSSTTDDLAEQREYLEQALATDPNSSAARRGLVLLSEKLERSRLLEVGQGVQARQPQQAEEATAAQVYLCPQCGGSLKFQAEQQKLQCDFCGYVQEMDAQPAGGEVEQVLDFVLPTTRGHRWAEAQHNLACERCGAWNMLPVGQTAGECAYCGSRQLIESAESRELVDPHAICLAAFDQEAARRHTKDWLRRGWFAPDDLIKLARTSALRPAYYPFWAFDGTLEMNWSCEINEGTSRNPVWARRDGVEFEMFDDVTVAGLRLLKPEELARIEPFDLKKAVEFEPEYLAGWVSMTYDLPLADASLKARESVAQKLRRELRNRVLLGREKRNLQSGGVNWSGQTFKLVLLPLWVGTYNYRNKRYRVLVNGQTGKVGGEKPRDDLKLTGFVLSVAATVALVVLGLFAASQYFGCFG
jgi:DNA-directed RNA polymerase subunit RPC12/RpoP